jgi:hypothetical protein
VSSTLAEEVVRVVAQGVVETMAALTAMQSPLQAITVNVVQANTVINQMTSSMSRAGQAGLNSSNSIATGFRRAARAIQQVDAMGQLITRRGPLSIGGIFAGASKNTVELDNFNRAMTQLQETVGDMFAPYVRGATQALIELTNAWKTLTPETQRAVISWAVFVSGAIATVAVVPIIARGIAGLAILFSGLASPIALAASAFVILGAVAVSVFETIDDANRGWVANFGDYLKVASNAADDFFTKMGKGVSKWQFGLSRAVGLFGVFLGEKAGLLNPGSVENTIREIKAEAAERDKALAGTADALGRIKPLGERLFGKDFGKAIDDAVEKIKNAMGDNGFHKHIKISFESLQDTWDRLQKAVADQDGDAGKVAKAQLNKLGDINDKLAEAVVAINGIGPWVA